MLPSPYRTVAAPAEDEFTEKKSRFIGYIAPVSTERHATTATPTVCGRIILPASPMTASRRAPPDAPF